MYGLFERDPLRDCGAKPPCGLRSCLVEEPFRGISIALLAGTIRNPTSNGTTTGLNSEHQTLAESPTSIGLDSVGQSGGGYSGFGTAAGLAEGRLSTSDLQPHRLPPARKSKSPGDRAVAATERKSQPPPLSRNAKALSWLRPLTAGACLLVFDLVGQSGGGRLSVETAAGLAEKQSATARAQ
jgi:hypothetical protein